MQWAIVCNIPMMLGRWVWNEEHTNQDWLYSEVPENTIINLIVYDDASPYTPPDNTRLTQVDDNLQIGDVI